MSLILDALRKADAERERGSVPGLRSQPVVPLSGAAAAPKSAVRFGWLPIAIGVAVGLLLAATWMMVGRGAQDSDAAAAAARIAQNGPASAPPILAPGDPLPPTAVTAVTEAALSPPAATRSPEQDVAAPAPWTRPGERGVAGTKDETQGTGAGSASAADAPIYPHELLPSQVRAALPQLSISGSIYSPDPAGRSLIVNGRLLRERDWLSQDLALEEIRLKSAIFVFRGYRFEVLF